MKAHVEIAARHAEGRGGSGGVLTLEVDVTDDLRVRGSQRVEKSEGAPARRPGLYDRLVGDVFERGVRAMGRIGGNAPAMIGDRVSQDAEEPCASASGVLQGRRALGGAQEGPLDDVFGIGLGPNASPSKAHEALPLPAEGHGESARVHAPLTCGLSPLAATTGGRPAQAG
jgi:hypothetical protein